MADEHRRDPEVRFQFGEQVRDLRLDGGVEPRRGLVRDQERGLAGKRHRDHRPLAHPARQGPRIVVEPKPRGIHPDPLEPVESAVPAFRFALVGRVKPDRLRDLPSHGEERIQRRLGVLEDHRDRLAADLAHQALDVFLPSHDVLAHFHDPAVGLGELHVVVKVLEQVLPDAVGLEPDPACDDARRGADEPHDGERRDALAAAALPHNAERLPFPDLEAHAVHRPDEGLTAFGKEIRLQVFDFQKGGSTQ